MKEMQYSSAQAMSALVETWVARANSRQRAGRAGRVRAGICYHLYTRDRGISLPEQQLPEMLRASLESIALKIKVLKLGSIASFLQKAIEPPPLAALTHVVRSLVALSALRVEGETEELTPLGFHLAGLPVDPRIGKLMLLGSVFQCVDPILTVAASISFRSPFYAPIDQRDMVDKLRRAFCPEQSDHLTVLKAYNGWQDARARGGSEERVYLSRNYLSYNTLCMIRDMKRQFAELLSEMGFLRSGVDKRHMERLTGDGVAEATGEVANKYSSNLKLVQAVIVAGFYPNVARVILPAKSKLAGKKGEKKIAPITPDQLSFESKSHGRVAIHPSSVLAAETKYPSPYVVFHEVVKTSKVYIREATVVTPYSLLLFGGEIKVNHRERSVVMDDWLPFACAPRTAVLIKQLREELFKLFSLKIDSPELELAELGNSNSQAVIEVISKLLQEEVTENSDSSRASGTHSTAHPQAAAQPAMQERLFHPDLFKHTSKVAAQLVPVADEHEVPRPSSDDDDDDKLLFAWPSASSTNSAAPRPNIIRNDVVMVAPGVPMNIQRAARMQNFINSYVEPLSGSETGYTTDINDILDEQDQVGYEAQISDLIPFHES